MAVRNEAMTKRLMSEPVAAHTPNCTERDLNRSGNTKGFGRISSSALRKLSAKPRAFAAQAARVVKVLLRQFHEGRALSKSDGGRRVVALVLLFNQRAVVRQTLTEQKGTFHQRRSSYVKRTAIR